MLLLGPINVLNDLLLKMGLSAETINFFVWPLIQIGLVVTLVALWVAYATYLERKISAFMQARLGPMRVGPWGLLQPIADGLKLLVKEDFIPENADRWIFFFAPYIAVASAFIVFSVIPFGPDWAVIADVNIGLLLVLAVSSVGVLALILAGWSSNSKYALLGGLRSSAQMVSYEVAMGLSLIGALMFARTLSLSGIVGAQGADSIWFVVYQPAGFMLFLISGIAENNRAPFDLPEAESELVAGFHTEYSGMRWSLFFMAEYAAMVVVSAVAATVYLGGWYFPFVYRLEESGHHNLYVLISLLVFLVKASLILYFYFWLRWTLPRFRYDQLMDIGWKWLIPSALINIVLSGFAIFLVQALDGWGKINTIESLQHGLNLTATGKALMIAIGLLGVLITAALLARINWRSRDFNLKTQRRNIKLVNVPKGKTGGATRELNMPLVKTPKPTLAQKLKRFFMIDLVKGLGLTLKYNLGAFTDKDAVAGKGIYTEQYPKVRPEVAPRFHGAPRLNMDPETHDTLCIACNLCAIACPEDCIDVIPMDVEIVVAGKPRRKKVLDEFIFDTSRCMFCALCQEACPTSCLELTQDFELATYSRAGFVWNREMLEQGRETVKYTS